MKEIVGDLWDYYQKPGFIILITTNNTIKSNGEGVMGRGCALQATKRIKGIARLLGAQLKRGAHHGGVFSLSSDVWAFPVKYEWKEPANLTLIQYSAESLGRLAVTRKDLTFILPRPGCGNGRLLWLEVKPVIENVLPNNVWVIDKG